MVKRYNSQLEFIIKKLIKIMSLFKINVTNKKINLFLVFYSILFYVTVVYNIKNYTSTSINIQ